MNKYDVRFCKCGRIHFMDMAHEEEVLNGGKYIIFVCRNCGRVTRIWFEDMFEGKCWCCNEVAEGAVDDLESLGELLTSRGFAVPMKNGKEASTYIPGMFLSENCSEVDVKSLISYIGDEEKLSSLSSYYVSGMSWEGTPYKKF